MALLGLFVTPVAKQHIEQTIGNTVSPTVTAVVILVLLAGIFGTLPDTDDASTTPDAAPDSDASGEAEAAAATTTTVTTTEAKGPTAAADQLELQMALHGYSSTNVIAERGRLKATYESTASTEDQLFEEVATFAVSYAGVVEDGYETGGLYVEIYSTDGEFAGSYRISREWVEQYNDGEMSKPELAYRILDSFEGPR